MIDIPDIKLQNIQDEHCLKTVHNIEEEHLFHKQAAVARQSGSMEGGSRPVKYKHEDQ